MPTHGARGVTFLNAETSEGTTSLRVTGSQITALCTVPESGDRVVDLHGDRLLPGLINAHDHLQLNSIERFHRGPHYRNAGEWIADVSAHRQAGTAFGASARLSREQRLLAGGLKNLLSGVTTVAHHDPLYPFLSRPRYPIRVVTEFGWAHSLQIDGDLRVHRSHRGTPASQPWIIHAAEGLDAAAAAEFDRLEALGCVGANTAIVHGLALSAAQQLRLAAAGAALIWCPGSNLHLFGRTADVAPLIARRCVALGTDSRLTGSRDLLEELRVAREVSALDERTLESLVTVASARLLRLADRGALRRAASADLVILPAQLPLSRATRADIRLVMIEGRVLYGDRACAELAAPFTSWETIRVDGRLKVMDRRLAVQLRDSGITEDGVELAVGSGKMRASSAPQQLTSGVAASG